jgi:Golgi nucleoside diphosphatase
MVEEHRHPLEAIESWEGHVHRHRHGHHHHDDHHRRLKEHHHHRDEAKKRLHHEERHEAKKEEKRLHELYTNPGIRQATVHGIMIDAGSTGSRLHVYEWKHRNLYDLADIEAVASGTMLSFPGTNTRWTDRLRPGLDSFATINDDMELLDALADYLAPLLAFATTILHEKKHSFDTFPIYLRGTAGLRMLTTNDRARVLSAVRQLLGNPAYNPFSFTNAEQARVLSGEEEAVYDWTAVNFLTGNLLEQSQGAGVAIANPKQKTHGALDLGGASTQISFYGPSNDIMSNLFKLQIGQAKHWNIYAHSFLFFGMNEAIDRFHAALLVVPVDNKDNKEHHNEPVENPCLPKGGSYTATTDIEYQNGMEAWSKDPHRDIKFTGTADYEACVILTTRLLHKSNNSWCDFAHRGDCSFAGVYQPQLPTDDATDFVAFSNYYSIWQFLQLPERATIHQLEHATKLRVDYPGMIYPSDTN